MMPSTHNSSARSNSARSSHPSHPRCTDPSRQLAPLPALTSDRKHLLPRLKSSEDLKPCIQGDSISEQRSPQSPTVTNSPSLTPEPSRPPSNSPADFDRSKSRRLTPDRSPPAATSSATTIPQLKRPRSPNQHAHTIPATINSYATDPRPSKMSRFATAPGQTDWNHSMQDRVVLPPLSTAVDNGLTPSRRTSIASPASYAPNGSYAFTNTFESQRPPTSSSMSSPPIGNASQDSHMHGSHPYRRPSLAGRSQSAVVGRSGPTSPLVQSTYGDPNSMSWNIPPPSAGATQEGTRPSTAYNSYTEYQGGSEFNGMAVTNEGTPQSPSFAFASSGFASTGPPSASMYAIGAHPRSAAHHTSFSLAQAATMQSQTTSPPPGSTASSATLMESSPGHTPTPVEEELSQLRTKVRELEFVNDLVQLRVAELESEKAKLMTGGGDRSGTSAHAAGVGTPGPDPDFQSSWDKRTEARIKRFCSLNRAGNALCAWHDSRRERRAYPPRMAPPGTLNCGCTYEEALFEESLSRHKVGSYLPGETVRMDPALRNPLLALLQWRYGYKDGDFERDPGTGKWIDGEGEHVWQQKASSGSTGSSRRKHSDPDSS